MNQIAKAVLALVSIWAMPGILGFLLIVEQLGQPYSVYWLAANILFISVALSIRLAFGVIVLFCWPFFIGYVYSNLGAIRGFFGI